MLYHVQEFAPCDQRILLRFLQCLLRSTAFRSLGNSGVQRACHLNPDRHHRCIRCGRGCAVCAGISRGLQTHSTENCSSEHSLPQVGTFGGLAGHSDILVHSGCVWGESNPRRREGWRAVLLWRPRIYSSGVCCTWCSICLSVIMEFSAHFRRGAESLYVVLDWTGILLRIARLHFRNDAQSPRRSTICVVTRNGLALVLCNDNLLRYPWIHGQVY
mmetsp:Transcript_43649/g.170829  ORF Transcript_43649/g.170829 Transcript_43649/m.170829 type:complete len:216 (+) Transcript_43649:2803-3450(+)